MNKAGKLFILLALVVIIGLPFLLQKSEKVTRFADDTVVIITPHTESIRYEFALAFERWYEEQTGRSIYVDYRVIGGTSEIGKFLNSEFTNSFRNYWEDKLGREWTITVQEAFNNPGIVPDESPEDDTPAQAARRAFLASESTSGIDLFFGGGTYDYKKQASMGTLVDAGLLDHYPDWFQDATTADTIPAAIPQSLSGEAYYDEAGRWYGTVLSSYGIIYNRDSLARLGIAEEPRQWSDLTDSRYFGQIAVSDPTKSGSMAQAFEMIIQQQMHLLVDESRRSKVEERKIGDWVPGEDDEQAAVREGWIKGMQTVQKIAANARYFTDTSQKPNIDVATGDCAAGMSIDFYGRFQQENILDRSGDTRFGFHVPVGGTTVSADPIGLLRGAENRKEAVMFIEFVLSLEGQKLWNFKVGEPGGPELFSLRRPPIRPELYDPKWNNSRTDVDFNPYIAAKDFTYRGDWTGRLFSEIRTIIRICFIDVRKELVEAWAAIVRAREEGRSSDADRAEAIMQNLSKISYVEAETTIDAALSGPRIEEVRLSRELSDHFRGQYKRAREVAAGH